MAFIEHVFIWHVLSLTLSRLTHVSGVPGVRERYGNHEFRNKFLRLLPLLDGDPEYVHPCVHRSISYAEVWVVVNDIADQDLA